MTLQYEASEADIVLANQELVAMPEGKQLWQRLRRFRMIVGGVVGVGCWLITSQTVLWLPIFILSGSVLLGVLLDTALRKRDIRVSVRRLVQESKGQGIVGARNMTLTPEGLVVVSATESQTTFWPSVETVLNTSSFLLFKKTDQSYILLPKRVFATPEHQAEFLAAAQRLQQGQGSQQALHQAWYQNKDQVG